MRWQKGSLQENHSVLKMRFFALGKNINFFFHENGHMAAYCKNKQTMDNQQNMQQMTRIPQEIEQRRHSFSRYTNNFHDYCYLFNEYGHKVVECNLYAKKSIRIPTPFPSYLGQIRCYLCINHGNKENECIFLNILKSFRENIKENIIQLKNEGNAGNINQPTKVWKKNKRV